MRYRVLYDLNVGTDPARPCGVIIERADCVEVIAPAEKAFAVRQTQPYDGPLYPDLSYPTYMPGDPEYFNMVCADLCRSFSMGEEFEYAGER